jgi:hypothetical protein
MKKIINLLLFCLIFWVGAYAQQQQPVIADEEDDPDAEFSGVSRIMIVPHNPSTGATIDIEKKVASKNLNAAKEEEAVAWNNFGLNENVAPRIVNLSGKEGLTDYTNEGDNDLTWIYASIDYKVEKRDKKLAVKNAMLMDNVMGKINSSKAKDLNVSKGYESDSKHKEYLNAVITDPNLLPHLTEKYGVKMFVFINQVEIYTNYDKYLDEENKIYERQIKLHYSVYDTKGGQILGDLAVINFFPAKNEDIDKIIMERFPVVSNFISSAFPDRELSKIKDDTN